MSNLVHLDAERHRRDPSRKVKLWAKGGLVYVHFADGKTVWFTPAQARLWSTALATLADSAEAEGRRG